MMSRCYPTLCKFKFNHDPIRLRRNTFSKPFISSISSNLHNLAFHSEPVNLSFDSPLSGLECVMMDYIFGKRKATEVAHSIWKHVVQKGDAVVDGTCGNGYDTLAMANMVADESCSGHVYSMDTQETALQSTMNLLDKSLPPHKKKMVELFATCHSRMEQVVPTGVTFRLVAFNLGYLPGGDKTIVTKSETTLLGMKAASRVVASEALSACWFMWAIPAAWKNMKWWKGLRPGYRLTSGYAANCRC